MKRHPALVPLSHDHHLTLARARELRRAAAEGDDAELERVSARFRRVFAGEVSRHFRDEEELLFPLLGAVEPPPQPLVDATVQHARIRALVQRLPARAAAAELGTLLDEHVRLEERVLFGLVQETVPGAALDALALPERGARDPVVDLLAGEGSGPQWGTETEDLNATLLAWPAGEATPEHVNEERDVVVVGVAGSGTLTLDGVEHPLGAATAVVVPKGARRRIEAGPAGIRYLTVHRRRGGLAVAPRER